MDCFLVRLRVLVIWADPKRVVSCRSPWLIVLDFLEVGNVLDSHLVLDLGRLDLIGENFIHVIDSWNHQILLWILNKSSPVDTVKIDFNIRLLHNQLIYMEDSLDGYEIGGSTDVNL